MSAIQATARGSGLYRVFVDDVLFSEHTAEREALENASEALAANPGARVRYEHAYVVDVVLVAPPEPDPVPPAPEPPPSGSGPDRTGLTLVGEHTFHAVEEGGWRRDSGGMQIVSPGVGRAFFAAGYQGGTAPFRLEHYGFVTTARRVVTTIRVRPSANWTGHSSQVNKLGYQWMPGGTWGRDACYFALRGAGSGPLYPYIAMQRTGEAPDGAKDLLQALVAAPRDQWTEIVYETVANTPGQPNGKGRCWVNGTLVIERADLNWTPAGTAEGFAAPAQIQPIYGGGTDFSAPADQWMDFALYRVEAGA